MATMRTYGDRCGVARALDVIGEHWALLVVRELIARAEAVPATCGRGLPRRRPTCSSPAAARKARGAGVVRRATLPPPSGARVCTRTTEWEQELQALVVGARAVGPLVAVSRRSR